jgi:hypothetical protein
VSEDGGDGARLGDEAQRLFAAVQDWARRTLPPPEEHSATCQWCPVCSFVAVLRGDRPDVTERFAEAGAAVATAMRALFPPAGESRGPDDDALGAEPDDGRP